jgi:hypothetical protein
VCTFGRDGEHGVGGGGAVDVGRVPHAAGKGAVVGQRGVEQRDGRLAARRAALPPDAALELAVGRGEGLRREVEELEGRRRRTTPRKTAAPGSSTRRTGGMLRMGLLERTTGS